MPYQVLCYSRLLAVTDYVTDGFISLPIAVVSFESDDGSGITLAVTESDGSLEVVLVLSKPVGEAVTVNVIATAMTATGLLNVFCILTIICLFSWWRFWSISELSSNFYCWISKTISEYSHY